MTTNKIISSIIKVRGKIKLFGAKRNTNRLSRTACRRKSYNMITNSIEIRVGLRTEASLLRRGSTRRYWGSAARSEYTKGRNPKDSSAPEPLPEICRFLVRKRISGPLLYFIASSSLLAILPKYTKQCMPCTSVTHNLQKCLPRIAAILDVTSGRGSPAAYQTILEPALTLVMPF